MMSALEQLDRTILLCRDHTAEELTNEEICLGLQSARVLCVSDISNLSSHSGQTGIITLVSLLSRMGMQVGLELPDVPLLRPQPPLRGLTVCSALMSSSGALITGATVQCDPRFEPDLIFALGDSPVRKRAAVPCWRLTGEDWGGAIAPEGELPAHIWSGGWPIGSMVSAALAAGEAFKFAMRRFPLRSPGDAQYFEPSRGSGWSFGPIPVPRGVLEFGEVDVVSAGAICQAALYALLQLPDTRLRGRIFDGDPTDASNLNRNMLTLLHDVNAGKAGLVASRCLPNFQLTAIPQRFVEGAGNASALAPRVLVGVDDIPSRWSVQRCAPGCVGVSGTSHFNILSSSHRPGEPCSGCLHYRNELTEGAPVPTVSFVSFWAGLALAVRLIREAIGSPYPAGQQQLWLSPLRMDGRHGGKWMPVAPRKDCPVRCPASVAAA